VAAKQYVESTIIDILAPAVGQYARYAEEHGAGRDEEALRYPGIAQIKSGARVLLTLHGGSGADGEDLRKAIAAGINIVHINTELRVAWRRGLEDGLARQPDEVAPYRILPYAVESVKQVARA
jgi:fructose-bisphosphate aldolase class II